MSKANIAVKAGCGCFLIVSGIIFFILKEVFNINGWLSLGIIIFSTIIIVTTSAIKVGKDEKRKKDEDDKKIVNISVKYPLAYADYLDKLKIKSHAQFIDSERRSFFSLTEEEWQEKEDSLKKTSKKANNVSMNKTIQKKSINESIENKITAHNSSNELPFINETKDMYFDSFNALKDIKDNAILKLEYLRPSNDNFMSDVFGLMGIMNDKETEKYFPEFYGEKCTKGLILYLNNTCQVTSIGIGFAYLMKEFGTYTCGIVKVTSPAHNRITNNFNHWLIDFIVVPESRRKGYATFAVRKILEVVQSMDAKEIFAMVECENKSSMKVLEKCGFYKTQLFDVGINPHTKNKAYLFRKIF